ncbi:divergent polysaccharide deacetylase family protein [Breoghania sp.]|uniref:divergent polysaccharide deacetylase family protein n=1 Tax=Breoghania sp. TaxID=2065378 RepID=UPI002AA8542A|nr:divergent polysaccharide deacetylase family protein [Breoghania sp.]
MAGDDLNSPLGLGIGEQRFRIPLGLIGIVIITALVLTLGVWIAVVDAPYGGEPSAVVALNKTSVQGVSARDMEVVGIRPGVLTNEPGQASREGQKSNDGPRFAPALPPEGAELRPADGGSPALTTDPDPRISEKGRYGTLPRIADNGARALDFYARPFDTETIGVARIAIVVGGLTLSEAGTNLALTRLPSAVTLAFAPYGDNLKDWEVRARQDGHELLLQVPLEPFDYPDNDPGPHTLLVDLAHQQNIDRLHWLLSRITNYVGVVNEMGSRFTATQDSLQPVLAEIGRRGLMYMDDGSSSRSTAPSVANITGTPFLRADLQLDRNPSRDDIDARLLELEAVARTKGFAVGYASALPVSIDRISEWAKSLEARGLQLVPISAGVLYNNS